MKSMTLLLVLACAAAAVAQGHADDLEVLGDGIPGTLRRPLSAWRYPAVAGEDSVRDSIEPEDMIHHYLTRLIDNRWRQWESSFEALTPDQIEARRLRTRSALRVLAGQLAETEITQQPRPVGTPIEKDGYRIERLTFLSHNHMWVTASVYLPTNPRYRWRRPCVVIPSGHEPQGKADLSYQRLAALLATNGMVTMVYDSLGAGERVQMPASGFKGSDEHDLINTGALPARLSAASILLKDAMRAVDVMRERRDVDRGKVAVVGHGPAGQTALQLLALDTRVTAAVLSDTITELDSFARKPAVEAQGYLRNQVAHNLFTTDLLMQRAPDARVLVVTATKGNLDAGTAWRTARYAQRFAAMAGEPLNVAVAEMPEQGLDEARQNAIVAWLAKTLSGIDEPDLRDEAARARRAERRSRQAPPQDDSVFQDPEASAEELLKVLDEQTGEARRDAAPGRREEDDYGFEPVRPSELYCIPGGRVMNLPRNITAYDFIESQFSQLEQQRLLRMRQLPLQRNISRITSLAGIRPRNQRSAAEIIEVGVIDRGPYKIRKLALTTEPGWVIPALHFLPGEITAEEVILYVHEDGKAAEAHEGGELDRLAREGRPVLAIDVCGTGETSIGTDLLEGRFGGRDYEAVHLALMAGKTLLGMRAEDMLAAAEVAYKAHDGLPWPRVRLVARGAMVLPALHAAAAERDMFRSVSIDAEPAPWAEMAAAIWLEPSLLLNAVPEAMGSYEIDNLLTYAREKVLEKRAEEAPGADEAPVTAPEEHGAPGESG